MRCPYCNVEYTAGEGCFCQAPLQAKSSAASVPARLQGPWGEAAPQWTEPRQRKSEMK